MVADLSNPATLNRYAYAFNNPLRYTDPTGHCNVDGTDGDDAAACADQVDQLGVYGVTVGDLAEGLWSLLDLTTMLDALKRFANAFGWDIARFRAQVGNVLVTQDPNYNTLAVGGFRAGVAWPRPDQGYTHIIFGQTAFYDGKGNYDTARFTRIVIHEFAHAWDYTSGVSNSRSLLALHRIRQRRGDTTEQMTEYGKNTQFERWAEAVASTVLQTDEVDDVQKERVRQRAAR